MSVLVGSVMVTNAVINCVQRELFVKVVSSHSIFMFLEWFTLTQMFDVFITDRLKHDFVSGNVDSRSICSAVF